MIKVYFGEHIVASREAFRDSVEKLQSKANLKVVSLNGKKTSFVEILEATQESTLFGERSALVLENFLKRPNSKEKKEILTYLNTLSEIDVCIWEDGSLTASQKKALKNASFLESKITKSMFTFLEALRPQQPIKLRRLYRQAVKEESPELLFAMMCRQVRLLLTANSGGKLSGPPWLQKKIKAQSHAFKEKDLLNLHAHLLEIDIKIKTGTAELPLSNLLDLLLLKL